VREIAEGFECGVKFENFNDLQEGDVIESYATKLTQSEL
jgi:translation initiation factor IF-2